MQKMWQPSGNSSGAAVSSRQREGSSHCLLLLLLNERERNRLKGRVRNTDYSHHSQPFLWRASTDYCATAFFLFLSRVGSRSSGKKKNAHPWLCGSVCRIEQYRLYTATTCASWTLLEPRGLQALRHVIFRGLWTILTRFGCSML